MSVVQLKDLSFSYPSRTHFRLDIDTFQLEASSRLFLEGPSGSGKTTFLNLLTGLLSPTSGQIHVLGTDITTLSSVQRDRFRADHFGIIFQLFNLLPYLSVSDNIILPCTLSKSRREKALASSPSLEEEARRLCNELDLEESHFNMPVSELSIGQRQRVSIARALIGQPEIIIADEPTSALDQERKDQFMKLLLEECDKYNASLLFVSHDPSLKAHFNHHLCLSDIVGGTGDIAATTEPATNGARTRNVTH